jgi:Serpin (serine protease inhibitor)
VLSTEEGNIVVSPLATQSTLMMALEGACGHTEENLAQGLFLPEERENIRLSFQMLIKDLSERVNNLVFCYLFWGVVRLLSFVHAIEIFVTSHFRDLRGF